MRMLKIQTMRARRFLPFMLVTLVLASSAFHLQASLKSLIGPASSRDPATAWDAHMRLVAAALPSDVRVVGYLEASDLDPSIPGPDQAEFYLTQYGLAPTVVQPGAVHEWIVGNFGNAVTVSQMDSGLDRILGAHSARSLGFGIYLIRRLTN
jgi:hypothetical protein